MNDQTRTKTKDLHARIFRIDRSLNSSKFSSFFRFSLNTKDNKNNLKMFARNYYSSY